MLVIFGTRGAIHHLQLTFCSLQMNEENAEGIRSSAEDRVVPPGSYMAEHEECVQLFSQWSELEQVSFVESLLAKMCHSQLGQVDCFLRPMLQRDFVSALPGTGTLFLLVTLMIAVVILTIQCASMLNLYSNNYYIK